MKPLRIFIVDDDLLYAEILEYHLSLNPDYEVEKFVTGKDFLKNLYKAPDIVTLDYSLPDLGCTEIMQAIRRFNPEIPIIIVSAQEDISTALSLLKEGAYDYIVKDDDTRERLWNTIKNARENLSLRSENAQLRREIGQKYDFERILIGNSPALHKVFQLMERAANTLINVSISGETGTGKELVAKAIHFNSNRKEQPFVPINVSAIPRELVESEMFGYEKGAFTGAVARKTGKFEQANKGTIFLDEIAEMDLNMQSKLLRVLQEREVTRVGGNTTIKVDVRVLTATHKNLAEEVKKGNFREDLYYRLLGLPIELPPLRDRGNDILVLAKYFVDEFAKANSLGEVSISQAARQKLMSYHYPGNVRELRAIIELAVVMANNGVIDAENISFNSISTAEDFLLEETTLKEYERRIIKHFLDKYDNNIQLVARKLDIGKSTIYRMLKGGDLN